MVTYWSLDEEQTLNVVYEKFRVVEEDTSKGETISYDVGITVKDSTENSYIVEWHYKNFEVESENEFMGMLTKISEDIKVLIKTDQYEAIQEVTNWEEVRDYNNKMIEMVNNPPLNQRL